MKPLIINFGSINVDHVYRVPHFVAPGETLASSGLATGLGGKGANQSVAIARAGGNVRHFGRISDNDTWARSLMQASGVDVSLVELVDGVSGHAIIQVDDQGENAIILHGGANQSFDRPALESALGQGDDVAYLLLQNECNLLANAIEIGAHNKIKIAFNPAPMSQDIKRLPLELLDTLIVNRGESEMLSDETEIDSIVDTLGSRLPNTRVVITLGADGAILVHNGEVNSIAAPSVNVVDTTAAGDTFVGYFLAGLVDGLDDIVSLERACLAASTTATRAGAIASIPTLEELAY